LRDQGVEIIAVAPDAVNGLDLAVVLKALGDRGLTRLLVEGGGGIAASLLRTNLVDRLVWMRAPLLIGGDGKPAVGEIALDELAGAPRFDLVSSEAVGGDVVDTFRAATS
jgi:diaminohydroxyphosphoribosylaminopyrimidine deaminase/5-amino-6-(5-phosphoribosylamino)uracil reductase